jgi:ATP-dependent Clp protease ATP-binding subunit ClpC
LRRAIQQYIEDPLSEKLLWKEFRVGETVIVDLEGDELVFKAIEGVEPPPTVELAGAGADS